MSFVERGACYVCDAEVVYNVLLAPIFKLDGRSYPLCQECVEYANPHRIARGMTPIKVWRGAYGPFNDEIKFQFSGRIGWPVIERPEPLLVGWRDKPDVYRLFGGVFWAATISASESEDVVSFDGKVE